jgi:hypothetical protein
LITAKDFAKNKAEHLALARDEGSTLTRDEAQEYILAVKSLHPIGIPLKSAIDEYVKAKTLVGASLLSICEETSLRRNNKLVRILVPDLVDQFIVAKNNAQKQGSYTYKAKLSKVAEYFKNSYIDQITTPEWTSFLNKIENGVTRNDIRKRITTLSRWAKNQGYLDNDSTPSIERTANTT